MSAAEPLPEEPTPEQRARLRTAEAGLAVLRGTSPTRGLWRVLPFLGPAFVAGVAYIDPGNFGTNIAAGSQFGYKLLWVVVLSNFMAMLIQHLSAKLGIATGNNLPETIREFWPRWASLGLWVISEVAAMATDLAEFLGGALGFNLLFHIPLFPAAILTGITTFAILWLQRYGFRPIEAIIGSLVAVIALCYLLETVLNHPNWGQVGYHSVVPFASSNSVLISVGILGATVMPHVVYLHSALTQARIQAQGDAEKLRLMRYNLVDVIFAMTLAGLVNLSMLYMAAATFHVHGFTGVADIQSAYRTLTPLVGPLAAVIFAVSLLASGVSSSAVGTMAGQVIMAGFVGWTVPVWLRRLVTMLPALIVIGLNASPTETLIVSQVVLSLVLPFAVVPLVWFTAKRSLMGALVNRVPTTFLATLAAIVIVSLNAVLLLKISGLV